MEEQEDPFRVYSDRQIEAAHFSWSPYMDLIAVLPSDPANLAISVWRLINDKQTGSPLLFTEKIPFTGTVLGWVPDKRSLAVGDVMGNVFVYDAERQRTIELQKVHTCPVSWIDWQDLGPLGDDFDIQCISGSHKLPTIVATPTSIAQLFGDSLAGTSGGQAETQVGECAVLTSESLASSNRFTVLSVLGSNGKVQMYSGGSIPIGEFSVASLFGVSEAHGSFLTLSMSPDMATVAVVSTTSTGVNLHLLSSSILKFKRTEIALVTRIQSCMHWLLKQLNLSLTTISRVVAHPLEDFDAALGDILSGELEDDFLRCLLGESGVECPAFTKDCIVRQFPSVAKLTKLSKSTTQGLDFLTSVLLTRVNVIVDHLTLAGCELADMGEWKAKYACLGLTADNTRAVLEQASRIKAQLNTVIGRAQTVSIVLRVVFSWMEALVEQTSTADQADGLNTAAKSPPPSPEMTTYVVNLLRQDPNVLHDLKSMVTFDAIMAECNSFEIAYVQLLSQQRRTIGGRFSPIRQLSFPTSKTTDLTQLRWTDNVLDLLWVDQSDGLGRLVYCQIDPSSGFTRRLHFVPPELTRWSLPRFYRDDRLCVMLMHGSESASICLLRVGQFLASAAESANAGVIDVLPVDYGYSTFLIAQQLPEWYLSASRLEVSVPRGLCSIYSQDNGRMMTLDLEGGDDEDGDGKSSDAGSENSVIKNKDPSSSEGENKFSNVSRKPSDEKGESEDDSPPLPTGAQKLNFS